MRETKSEQEQKSPSLRFVQVLEDELDVLKGPREESLKAKHGSVEERRAVLRRAHDSGTVGLAFSGGGIRSATFNLGVLQALADLRLLDRFDYLSTVSGGGYIGSWFTAWIKRSGFSVVEKALAPNRPGAGVPEAGRMEGATPSGQTDREPAEIRFLRSYSNYLTPKLGWFGADTWTAISIYLRNFLLNLLILVSALAAVLLLPRLLWWSTHFIADSIVALSVVLGILILVAAIFLARNLATFKPVRAEQPREGEQGAGKVGTPPTKDGPPRYTFQGAIQMGIVLPLMFAAVVGSLLLWGVPPLLRAFDWPWPAWVQLFSFSLRFSGGWLTRGARRPGRAVARQSGRH